MRYFISGFFIIKKRLKYMDSEKIIIKQAEKFFLIWLKEWRLLW